MLHDFQSEQETKQSMLRLSSLFIMLNRVRIFLCADYYKHHRYIASMKQVAYLIADAIDKSRKHVRHFLKNATKCQVKKAAPTTKTFTIHKQSIEAKAWPAEPNMHLWPQQLNLCRVVCNTGRGISPKILQGKRFTMPPQLRSFYRFRVYFTVPRIIFQMGGIQSI